MTIPIFSRKLAVILQEKGFVPVRIEPNIKFPQYNVFFFRNSPALRAVVRAYQNK